MNTDQFLEQNHHEKITAGMGGADVYSINNEAILKRAKKCDMTDENYESFKKEAQFYHYANQYKLNFVPEVISFFNSNLNEEVGILIKQYKPLKVSEFNKTKEKSNKLLENIFLSLSKLHRLQLPSPNFLQKPKNEPVHFNSSDLRSYSEGWISVLNEHPDINWNDIPSIDVIGQMSSTINDINSRVFTPKSVLNHGDFHLGNCLIDDNYNILFCDWQNVGFGNPAGDLSFFISRLGADGINLTEEDVISLYLQNYPDDIDKNLMKNEILDSMHLAEMNTSFMFWHEYLHNCPKERVLHVFKKMADSWNALK